MHKETDTPPQEPATSLCESLQPGEKKPRHSPQTSLLLFGGFEGV